MSEVTPEFKRDRDILVALVPQDRVYQAVALGENLEREALKSMSADPSAVDFEKIVGEELMILAGGLVDRGHAPPEDSEESAVEVALRVLDEATNRCKEYATDIDKANQLAEGAREQALKDARTISDLRVELDKLKTPTPGPSKVNTVETKPKAPKPAPLPGDKAPEEEF